MVNWDPPISQVIHLPGTIQKGNTSIASQELLLYPVKHCTSTEPPGIIVLIRELMSAHELPTSANSATRASTTALLYHPYYSTTVALQWYCSKCSLWGGAIAQSYLRRGESERGRSATVVLLYTVQLYSAWVLIRIIIIYSQWVQYSTVYTVLYIPWKIP